MMNLDEYRKHIKGKSTDLVDKLTKHTQDEAKVTRLEVKDKKTEAHFKAKERL